MKMIDRIAKRLGYVKPTARRAFAGAQVDRLTSSWQTSPTSINVELEKSLRILRARARDLTQSNEYASRFMGMCKTNVVGSTGIMLQVKAKRRNGEVDSDDSQTLEDGFKEWGKRGNCDVTGKLSWMDAQNLWIQTLATDGEVIVRYVSGRGRGRFAFQLQFLDANLLDETLNQQAPNGNWIRMGVEQDDWKKPTALWLYGSDPYDYRTVTMRGTKYQRVPIEEIHHDFFLEAIDQIRGKPWLAPSMMRTQMLGGFEEAAVVAARTGAAQMGFWTTPSGDAMIGDDIDGDGNQIIESEPGTFRQLPADSNFFGYNPQYPHGHYEAFVKACLRGVAAGLNVSYTSLANDLEGVNYSSARVGVLEEREVWKGVQGFMIERFCQPVYSSWLPWAIMSGALGLPAERITKFDAATWQGRRWQWVDPAKEAAANQTAVEMRIRSRSDIIRDGGKDPQDVWREIQSEEEIMKSLGIMPTASSPTPSPPEPDEEDMSEETPSRSRRSLAAVK